ncbi:MAG TPA: hypothetical protein VGE93_06400 [Bryobacteraceae bacterium]
MEDAFDFGNIAAEEVEESPEASGGKRRKYEVNPFEQWVKESYETGNGKQVVLPPKAVKDALKLIRDAAEDLGIGARTRLYNKGQRLNQNETDALAPQAKVTVKFWGTEKKNYNPRKTSATVEETVPAPAE